MLIEKDIIAADQWDGIERLFKNLEPIDGKTTAGHQIKHLKQSSIFTDKHISPTIFTKEVVRVLATALHGFKNANIRLSTYKKGDFYDWHVDAQHNKSHNSPIESNVFSLSYTIFLNDPKNYTGGELDVRTENGMQTFKLNKGDMVLYPSDYLHRVRKITKGKRKVALGWIQPIIPNEKDRFTLTELHKSQELLKGVEQVLEDCKEKDDLVKAYTKLHFIRTQFMRKCYHNL
tara:strand:- start:492 stop:1187 length:696 start_codon:yes stop_codon:yes gene_type:complete